MKTKQIELRIVNRTREGAKAKARAWVEAQGKVVVRMGRVTNRPSEVYTQVQVYEVRMEVGVR